MPSGRAEGPWGGQIQILACMHAAPATCRRVKPRAPMSFLAADAKSLHKTARCVRPMRPISATGPLTSLVPGCSLLLLLNVCAMSVLRHPPATSPCPYAATGAGGHQDPGGGGRRQLQEANHIRRTGGWVSLFVPFLWTPLVPVGGGLPRSSQWSAKSPDVARVLVVVVVVVVMVYAHT